MGESLKETYTRAIDSGDLGNAIRALTEWAKLAKVYPVEQKASTAASSAPESQAGQAHEKPCQYTEAELVAEIQERKLEREKMRLSDRGDSLPQVVVREPINVDDQTLA